MSFKITENVWEHAVFKVHFYLRRLQFSKKFTLLLYTIVMIIWPEGL